MDEVFMKLMGFLLTCFLLEFEAPFVQRKELENQVPSIHEIENEGQKTTGKPKTILCGPDHQPN
jgi:hypothetical protein